MNIEICTKCGQKVLNQSLFCHNCGTPVPPKTLQCPSCRTQIITNFAFCPSCGYKLISKPQPVSMPQSVLLPQPTSMPQHVVIENICKNCKKSLYQHEKQLCAQCKTKLDICFYCGKLLPKNEKVCGHCHGNLLAPGDFKLQTEDYQFPGDIEALNKLKKIPAFETIIKKISKSIGKPWLEAQFIGSGIKVGKEQFPDIYNMTLQASTVLNLSQMPDIYISGDQAWNSDTFGTACDAFIVLGSFLIKSLKPHELLFVIARNVGLIKSGYAMYRTVARVLSGRSAQPGVMKGGFLSFLDFEKLITLPIEIPLLSWMRQSEITADRAGLIVVRDLESARSAVLMTSLKSRDMLKKINIDSYLEQQDKLDDNITKLNEFLSQSSPFIAKRVRYINEFEKTRIYNNLKLSIENSNDLKPVIQSIDNLGYEKEKATSREKITGICPECKRQFSIGKEKFAEKTSVKLKCSNCKALFTIKRKKGDNFHE